MVGGALYLSYFDKPLRLHSDEILPNVRWQRARRIQHLRLSAYSLEDNPVPEVFVLLLTGQ